MDELEGLTIEELQLLHDSVPFTFASDPEGEEQRERISNRIEELEEAQ